MSFKREGNDQSQSNILKKRRVAELLSNFIPEDEVALMKNERYTCLVCSYRLVFDTVDRLTLHRKGKIHFLWMKCSAPLLTQTCKLTHHTLLKTVIYLFGTKRPGTLFSQRRHRSRNLYDSSKEEHYLKLKSAGRLQDRSDPWVKDENVEFDSDEEEPSSLPSSH
uniref:Sodium channel modifier 1 n=1 Tax=Oncorhynchus mykiss TaxID=8022 RepID=A0A8C7PK74_ONCMY